MVKLPKEETPPEKPDAELSPLPELPPIPPESVGVITRWDARLFYFEYKPSEIAEWAERGIMPIESALTILQMRSRVYAILLNRGYTSYYVTGIGYRLSHNP
jgi:hypothetical protein